MSTPIRTVTFSATPSGVTPDQPQFAGVQGDHNATSVVFALDEALVNAAYQYRFEFVDGAGGYDTTDFVALENSQASCLLPGNWTGAGSTGTIRLCAVILGADNTEEQVVYTLSGRLKFASRDTGAPMETEYEKGLSGLIADTKDAADAANQAAADAGAAADAAQAVADTLADYYAGQAMIRVHPLGEGTDGGFLAANKLAGKDTLEIFCLPNPDGTQLQLISLFDNLGKGSSGAAVQCMNLMLGLEETKGLAR